MAIDEAAILRLAKELAKQDGFAWELEWKPPLPKYSKIILLSVLSEGERCKYLARAREELTRGDFG
jgi:hypothetical protein